MLEKIVQTIEEKEALIATLKQEVKDLKATLVDPVKLIIKRLDAVECKLNSIEHSLAQNFVRLPLVYSQRIPSGTEAP